MMQDGKYLDLVSGEIIWANAAVSQVNMAVMLRGLHSAMACLFTVTDQARLEPKGRVVFS
jgi:hypothetical protein